MQTKSKIILVAAIMGTVALIPVVGPFTFYHAVVPVLGPILPRHHGVPQHASAHFSVIGSGLIWSWEQTLPSGCAKWDTSDDMVFYYNVKLTTGANGCLSSGLSISYGLGEDHIVIYDGKKGRRQGGGKPCPFTISDAQMAVLNQLLQQAKIASQSEVELRALRSMERRLANIDGEALTTDDSSGCNDLSLADYGNS